MRSTCQRGAAVDVLGDADAVERSASGTNVTRPLDTSAAMPAAVACSSPGTTSPGTITRPPLVSGTHAT